MRRLNIIDAFFVLVLVGLTIAFYRVLGLFIIDIFLAMVLANIFWKMYLGFGKIFKTRKGPASAISVIIILIAIGGVLTFLIIFLSRELTGGMASLREQWPGLMERLRGAKIPEFLRQIPFIQELIDEGDISNLTRFIERIMSRSSNLLVSLAQKSFTSISGFVVHLIFTLFITYFMFIDGPKLLARVKSLIPLGDKDTAELMREIANTTRATIVTTVIIGVIEGTYGGMIFFISGLPSPVLWGVIIFFFSLVPVIGANVILVPAGVIKIVTGHYLAGILIIALGLSGIAVTQNVIRPKLLGGRSGLHPMIVLLSTLGGIAWLGLIGFLVGPIIAALFIVIWRQFGQRFRAELEGKNKDID